MQSNDGHSKCWRTISSQAQPGALVENQRTRSRRQLKLNEKIPKNQWFSGILFIILLFQGYKGGFQIRGLL